MKRPPIVSADQWQAARDELLVAEKAVTRQQDAVAAQRRRLPMMRFDGPYAFASADGSSSLAELFEDRDVLVVYQHMDTGPDGFCPGCTSFCQNIGRLESLAGLGITFCVVSNMPLAQLQGRKEELGWQMPVYSSRETSFADDCGAGGGFGLSAFLRDGDQVFRTYTTMGRGVDHMLWDYNIADVTAYGRKQDWEDSPEGWPKS